MTGIFQDLFELKCILENIDVRLSSRIESGVKQLIALVTSNGDIVLHYSYGELPSVIKRIPWFTENAKLIQAICFDPTATWLLSVSVDGSLYIIPALSLVDKKQKIDCKWSVSDLTYFPKHTEAPDSKPLCVIWWQTLDSNQNALIGYENGAISLISLTDGRCIGISNVSEAVTHLCLCQDNNTDIISLLINGESGMQWRMLLEQHSAGYLWPPEINNQTDDSARSRLLSLKQIGVDKLVSLRQRIAEARGTRRDSQTSDSASESSSHSESIHVGPELLPHLNDMYFASQYARNRHLLSAFYKPTSLLTVHTIDVETAPLYVHKLTPNTQSVLLTDRLIYTINDKFNMISVVSSQYSECRLEGDSEFNPDSLLASFNLKNDDEKVINIYKATDLSMRRSSDHKRDKDNKMYTLPKSVDELHLRKPKLDTCVVVTTNALYKIIFSCSPVDKFVHLITEGSNLERAERLSLIFGLNWQQLLECSGDILIANGSYHSGLILYKQAKVHLLKRVLKLAISADSRALLKFVHLCLSASKVDMSLDTKIHIGNMAVMAYTELILRHGGHQRICNTKDFMNFLCYEELYDQVLAVNVARQANLWNVVSLLAKCRGIQPDVVTTISQILQTTRAPSPNDKDFLLTISDACLTQSLLIDPPHCQIHLNYVRSYVDVFPLDILHRLLIQLDPSQPCIAPLISRLFQRTNNHSSSIESTIDSVDFENPDKSVIIMKDLIETFICILITYVKKKGFEYDLNLLDRIIPPDSLIEHPNIKRFPDLHPLSCGYEHAAVIRNNCVYSMGVNSGGCLGLGPMLTQSSTPKIIQTLADLKVKALAVSCGRKHTLILTDYGVYSCGSNFYGQLGVGPVVQETPYPQLLNSLACKRIIDISAGQYHSLALTACGQVYSWGWGIHGQLGHGTCNNEYYPKLLKFKHRIMQVAAGHAHSLILACDGKLYGFGSNAFGQLESCSIDGNKTTRPVWVLLMPDIYTPIEKIATTYFHNIAIRADQEVYTWGASPQEVRLSQSKHSQKLNGVGLKTIEPWKSSVHIYSSINRKPIEQVAVGYRHSVILHNGKILWGKNKDGELSPPKLKEQDNLTIFNQRFLHVSCGLDYTMALEQSGKVLAWGTSSMAQTILGRPLEDDKQLDGKIVIFKNTKRIIKFPNTLQGNSDAFPVEVPGLPTMAITYNTCDYRNLHRNFLPYAIRAVENDNFLNSAEYNKPLLKNSSAVDYTEVEQIPFKFGQKTLHYVLETYYGFYDTENILGKCLDVNNYQAASKIAIMDGHYSDSLGFQLNAFKKYLDLYTLNFTFKKTEEESENEKLNFNLILTSAKKEHFDEKIEKVNHSPARILSSSSSLDSIRQWGDDLDHQGGRESPCDFTEMGDIRQSVTQYVQSVNNENSPPISSVSKLITESNKIMCDYSNEIDVYIEDTETKEIIRNAAHLIEFYVQKTYASENHILMQNILMKCIEFWLINNLPVVILENILLKNMDKYFYPLSILLFCKNFNNSVDEEIVKKDDDIKLEKSAGFLKEFSTKFCLQLCSMVLENVNKA